MSTPVKENLSPTKNTPSPTKKPKRIAPPAPKFVNEEKETIETDEKIKLEVLPLSMDTLPDQQLQRIFNFIDMHKWLNTLDVNDLCSLTGTLSDELFENTEKGINSNIFKIPIKNLAAKVMEDLNSNRREINYYRTYTPYVLNGGYPHFPLVSRHSECQACKYTKGNTELTLQNCLVLFSELFDGSLTDLVNNSFGYDEADNE
jgi:hypothetical protein